MNFLLRNLELSLTETHLLVGEKLLEEGKVSSIFESERNLWVAEVDGFETEMQISPTRVRACSCECSIFVSEKMCGHVAAGLLALRRLISEKKHRSKASKKQNRTYKKLTVNAILDQVGKEELSAFVRNFARGNRNFSIALKTRFAGAVPMSDNTEKYRQVLDSVIKSSRKKNGAVSAAGAKLIMATAVNLLGQATDSIALEHYADGWPILKVMVNKIIPIASRIEYDTPQFMAILEELFELIQKLISLPIPPDLKLETWDFLLEESVRPSHRGYNIGVRFYDLLVQLAGDKARSEKLLATVEQELKKQNLYSDIHFAKLLSTKMIVLKKRGFKKQSDKFIKEILQSMDSTLLAVNVALENDLFATAKTLATKGLKLNNHQLYQFRLKAALLDIALFEKNKNEIIGYAKDCFLATGTLKYFRFCKQYNKSNWNSFAKNIIKEIKNRNKADKNKILADIYAEEKMFDKLSEHLLQINSIEKTMEYDHHFIPQNEVLLYSIYVKILDRYLSNHIGVKPTQKILSIFSHLRKLEANKLVDKLVAYIRKHHPVRMELAMELLLT